mmetsp:Transcript_17295/g.12358  ORF Transcript_17295/g.12358 Transcript_17295/m.12358 type:complete len:90 (+) Transcript_17295:1096-1365(+)
MTSSEDDEPQISEDQRGQLINAQKRINQYRFKRSFLYLMCWSDLNTHYAYKLLFFVGVAVRRMIYAFALVEMGGYICAQIKYFTMLNVI